MTTGTCPAGELITDNAMCESAAEFLGLGDTTVTETDYSYSRPLGCVYWPGLVSLYMQTAGSSACTSEINCICKLLAPGTPTPAPTSDPSPDHPVRKPRVFDGVCYPIVGVRITRKLRP